MTVETTGLTTYLTIGGQVISGDGVRLTASGVGVTFTKLTGWWEPPASSGTVTQRSGLHGAYANEAFLTERNIVVEGEVFAPNRVALVNGIEDLLAAIPINELTPFAVYEEGLGMRHAMVRQGGQHIVDWQGKADPNSDGLTAAFSVQLVAPDPLRLSGDGSAPTKVSENPYGLMETIVNAGKGLVPPMVFTISGVTDAYITINGVVTFFATGPADTLVVDLKRRSVKINGQTAFSAMTGPLPKMTGVSDDINIGGQAFALGSIVRYETYDSYR